MPDQYTRMGKQILDKDGEHFADGASTAAAVTILEKFEPTAILLMRDHIDFRMRDRRLFWCRLHVQGIDQTWWTDWKWLIGTATGRDHKLIPHNSEHWSFEADFTGTSYAKVIDRELYGSIPLPDPLAQFKTDKG